MSSTESGPKKIDEIHKDIRQEKIDNEKARDQYDRERDRHGGRHGGGIRTSSNSLKETGPVQRNSIERNRPHNLPEEEAAIKECCEKVRSLMNEMTPTSQKPLTEEFISFNDTQLTQVVGIMFDKAVEKPKFCALYAEMCKAQAGHELTKHNGTSASRNKVLTRMLKTFQDKKDIDEDKLELIEKEEDPAKKELMLIEERQKFRRRKFGVMIFIGHLFRNQLLSTKIVINCASELFASILPKKVDDKEVELKKEDVDEESVHCGLQLIETVGPLLDSGKEKVTGAAFLDQWSMKLEAAKPVCSNEIRFMIMNLIELRKDKWVPRKSTESGPKKTDDKPVRYCVTRSPTISPTKSSSSAFAAVAAAWEIEPRGLPADEREEALATIMKTITTDLREFVSGDLQQEEMIKTFAEFVGKEKYGFPLLVEVYEMAIRAVCEKNHSDEERKKLALVLRLSLTEKEQKQAFIDGVTQFFKYVVEVEMYSKYPKLWNNTAEVLINASRIVPEENKVELLSMTDLAPAFLAAKTEGKKKFDLFVNVLKHQAEAEIAETGNIEGTTWELHELQIREEMEKDGLRAEMDAVELSNKAKLSSLFIYDREILI